MSAHCSLSPDDVFVCCVGSMCVVLGPFVLCWVHLCCVGSICVVLSPAVSADWLPSCAPAACVFVAVEHSVTCTCTKVE